MPRTKEQRAVGWQRYYAKNHDTFLIHQRKRRKVILEKRRLEYPRVELSTEQRFWSKVTKTDICWNWMGGKSAAGYGYFYAELRPNKIVRAHRWSYEQANGPIPDGLQMDHLCRNHACVRPDHLEAVTGKENQARSPRVMATHCQFGHPLTIVDKTNNWRGCPICKKQSSRKSYERKTPEQRERTRVRALKYYHDHKEAP